MYGSMWLAEPKLQPIRWHLASWRMLVQSSNWLISPSSLKVYAAFCRPLVPSFRNQRIWSSNGGQEVSVDVSDGSKVTHQRKIHWLPSIHRPDCPFAWVTATEYDSQDAVGPENPLEAEQVMLIYLPACGDAAVHARLTDISSNSSLKVMSELLLLR